MEPHSLKALYVFDINIHKKKEKKRKNYVQTPLQNQDDIITIPCVPLPVSLEA